MSTRGRQQLTRPTLVRAPRSPTSCPPYSKPPSPIEPTCPSPRCSRAALEPGVGCVVYGWAYLINGRQKVVNWDLYETGCVNDMTTSSPETVRLPSFVRDVTLGCTMGTGTVSTRKMRIFHRQRLIDGLYATLSGQLLKNRNGSAIFAYCQVSRDLSFPCLSI